MTLTKETLRDITTNEGISLLDWSNKQVVLLIFLRHFGCTFCREALEDIALLRKKLETKNVKIIFVHMADNETASIYFERYNLVQISHISDPSCHWYEYFGLAKGNFNQLFGLKSWMRGFQAGVIKGHWLGKLAGDGLQMPGVFVLHQGQIKEKHIHNTASERPNYEALVLKHLPN